MSLSKAEFGNFELCTIETGDIKLDGGAMFGVVPKTLWSRHIGVDEKNRISMTMRCLLIKSRATGNVYLIDNGAGTKFSDKMESIYQLEYAEKNLHNSLNKHGFSVHDITDLIFTHLHFDHCGGTTYYDEQKELQHTFSNAEYHINKRHWETATHPNAREKASFLKENIQPISESGRLNLVEDSHEFEPGLTVYNVNGHTIGQQLPVIKSENRTLVFAADLLPTHVHVPLPWVMGYDMYPVQTLQEKESFLKKASQQNWLLYLEHDRDIEIITTGYDGEKFNANKKMSLSDI